MSDVDLPEFGDQLLLLRCEGGSGESATTLLHRPAFERLGHRLFLVGEIPQTGPGDWLAGRRCAVAWDRVVEYVVFESLEDYQSRLRR